MMHAGTHTKGMMHEATDLSARSTLRTLALRTLAAGSLATTARSFAATAGTLAAPLLLLEALLLLLSSSPVPRRLNLRWTASMSPNVSSRPSVSAAKMRSPPPSASAWTEPAARRRPKIATASFLVPTSMVDNRCFDEGSLKRRGR